MLCKKYFRLNCFISFAPISFCQVFVHILATLEVLSISTKELQNGFIGITATVCLGVIPIVRTEGGSEKSCGREGRFQKVCAFFHPSQKSQCLISAKLFNVYPRCIFEISYEKTIEKRQELKIFSFKNYWKLNYFLNRHLLIESDF